MIPGVKVIEQYVFKQQFSFIDIPIKENLLSDIKHLFQKIDTGVLSIEQQKQSVFVLNYHLKQYLDICKCEILDYYARKVLYELKHFIIIKNKSFYNFKIELQLIIEGNIYLISSK